MKDDKSFSNSSRADKALHLIAATVLCGAVLNAPIEALSLQSSRFAIIEVQADPDQVFAGKTQAKGQDRQAKIS